MFYRIVYHKEVIQDLKKVSHDIQRRIIKNIEERLSREPEIYGKPLRYTLKGLWVLRVGDYRVVYSIEKEEIIILRIGHRKEVYER